MEKSNFDQLLYRYIKGEVTHDEREKLDAWLEVVRTEHDSHLKLTKSDEERLFRQITSQVTRVEDVIRFVPQPYREPRLFQTTWFKVAASLLLLIAASFTLWYQGIPRSSDGMATFSGGKAMLQDGTIVWLDDGSELTYMEDAKTGARTATLTGEGFFEVARDPERPFTISCGDINVKVIGTSFRLRNNPEGIELNVVTGKVNVSTADDPEGELVTQHEKLVYATNGKHLRSTMEPVEVSAVVSGTEYDLNFENAVMRDVLAKLSRKFDRKFEVKDMTVHQCHVTADLSDKSLEETLLLLSEILHIGYAIDGNVVTLSGSGC